MDNNRKNKNYLAIFAFATSDPKRPIIHMTPAKIYFRGETEPVSLDLQKVITNREDMHKFIDKYFDQLEQIK